jgi:hypothetical protein
MPNLLYATKQRKIAQRMDENGSLISLEADAAS